MEGVAFLKAVKAWAIALGTLLMLVPSTAAFAAGTSVTGYTALAGSSLPKVVAKAVKPLGPVRGSTEVSFLIGLPSQNLGGLLAAAKASSSTHSGLTQLQEANLYGANPSVVESVQSFMQGQGFVYIGETPNGLALQFTGTAAQVDSTFRTTLEQYAFEGHVGYAPNGGLSVPASLAGEVQGVLGLNTLLQPVSMLKGIGKVGTPSASTSSYGSLQMETAYHMAPLFQQGYEGQGETIAVATFAPYDLSDVQAFDAQMGLPAEKIATPDPYEVVGGPASDVAQQAGTDETTVDLEWSHTFAPQAQQEVAVGDDLTYPSFPMALYEVYSALSSGNDGLKIPDVITVSWGYPEAYAPIETNQMLDELFASIAAQGISMFAASGDGDVVDDNVLYPASDPFILGVGGTQVQLNTDGTIASEPAWGGTAANVFYTASTGGYSEQFAAPPWAAGAQSTYAPGYGEPYLPGMRGVPDVSLNAVNLLGFWSGEWWSFVGTSLSSPSWAGIFADIDQLSRAKTGSGLGFVAPQLYYAAQNDQPSPFHDITTGSNSVYAAEPGWDPVTGLGTPDATALAQDLVANSGLATFDSQAFISAVSSTGSGDTWLGTDPLPWVGTPNQIANLTDTVVAGTTAHISGTGFGTVTGSVYLTGVNGGALDEQLEVQSWSDNEIDVSIPPSLTDSSSPAVYLLDVFPSGASTPLQIGVQLTGGIMLDGHGPLALDTPSAVQVASSSTGPTSNTEATILVSEQLTNGAVSVPAEALVTVSNASFGQSGATIVDGMYDGLNSYGLPEYLVQLTNGQFSVYDYTAENVSLIVQDPNNPSMAPGEASLQFQAGPPTSVEWTIGGATWSGEPGQSDVVEAATYDPTQSVPIQLNLVDANGNPLDDTTSGWTVSVSQATYAAVYWAQEPAPNVTFLDPSQYAWTPATSNGTGVFSVPDTTGPIVVGITDPTVGDTVYAEAYSSTYSSAYPVPLVIDIVSSTSGMPQSVPSMALSATDTTVGAPGSVTLTFTGGGNSTAYLSTSAQSIYDTQGAELLPDQQGLYEIPLQDGSATVKYASDAAGPLTFYAWTFGQDNVPYSAFTQANVSPGPEAMLGAVVLNAAAVSGDASSTLPGNATAQQVIANLFDAYGNPVSSGDNIGLTINAPNPTALTVTDGSGNVITPTAGVYTIPAQAGSAMFLVYSAVPQEVSYQAADLTDASVASVTQQLVGDFFTPYATQLNLTAGYGVAQGSVWSATPELVQINVADQSGSEVTSNSDDVALTITAPAGATLTVRSVPSGKVLAATAGTTYTVPMENGTALVAVTSSVAGQIGYQVSDLTTPSVTPTSGSADVMPYPMDFSSTASVTITSGGSSVTTLTAGNQYTITASFQNYGNAMAGMPIIEVIGPNGVAMQPVGFYSSQIVSGAPIQESTYFTPPSSGTYTVKAFIWSAWLDNGVAGRAI